MKSSIVWYMEGVSRMSEKRWVVSPEQLRALREIRINCQLCDDCSYCPLHIADDPYNICRLAIGMYPMSWDFTGLEVERDG